MTAGSEGVDLFDNGWFRLSVRLNRWMLTLVISTNICVHKCTNQMMALRADVFTCWTQRAFCHGSSFFNNIDITIAFFANFFWYRLQTWGLCVYILISYLFDLICHLYLMLTMFLQSRRHLFMRALFIISDCGVCSDMIQASSIWAHIIIVSRFIKGRTYSVSFLYILNFIDLKNHVVCSLLWKRRSLPTLWGLSSKWRLLSFPIIKTLKLFWCSLASRWSPVN